MEHRELLERAGKTFAEAFIASLVANLTILSETSGGGWKSCLLSIGLGALAAGISAVWNGVAEPLLKIRGKK